MKPGKTVGPRGADDIGNEFNFNDLSNMMKKMGILVEVVANDFNKAVVSVNDVFDKLSISLTDEEKDQINTLFDRLSAKDRDVLLNMVKNHATDSELRLWWEQRCDNKHIIDILISCAEAFSEIFNTGNDIENLIDNFGGLLGTEGKKESKNIMGELLGMLEKEFGVSFGSKTSTEKGRETNNDKCDIKDNNKENNKTENDEGEKSEKDAVFLSNLGNSVSNAIRHFQDKDEEDENSIKNKIFDAFSETGISREYMDKCFVTGVEMGKKLIELEEEYENKSQLDDDKDQTEQTANNEQTANTGQTDQTKNSWDGVLDDVGKYMRDVRLYFAELDKLS